MKVNNEQKTKVMPLELILVVLLFFVAIFLRFWLLGHAAFRSDTMEFYKLALWNQDILEFWRNPPWLNQMPLNETLSLLLIKAGLPATPFVVRLPFAIMGVLAVFFVWGFTRQQFGREAALVVLAWAAFNPYQIYFSRMAYHYSGAICWSAAMLWAFWKLIIALRKHQMPQNRAWFYWFAAAILSAYMHMSTWVVVAIQGVWLFIAIARTPLPIRKHALIAFGTGIVVALLLMIRWIWRAVLMVLDGTEQIGEEAASEYLRLFPAYFSGQNVVALILLFIVVCLSVWALFGPATERHKEYRLLGLIAAIHWVIAFVYVHIVGGGLAKISYFSALWPFMLIPLGVGVGNGIRRFPKASPRVSAVTLSMAAVTYVAVVIIPTWAVVTLDGKPTPYHRINQWVLENLPTGTPILTDRWFEPWNELAVHNKDDIAYTFTVPDEPIENYMRLNWRDTAIRFFERHPTAAFLQLTPRRYEDQLGRWTFPETHFARSSTIANDSAMTLRRWQVFPEDFSEANDRVEVRIFYNTPEDLIHRARARGQALVWWPDEHWTFFKPWQPLRGWPEQLMQSLWIQAGVFNETGRLFRHLGELNQFPQDQLVRFHELGRWADFSQASPHSTINLYNTSPASHNATLSIVGIAVSGPIRIRTQGQTLDFQPGLLTRQQVQVNLAPGLTSISFAIRQGEILLLTDIRVEETE